MKVSRKKLWEDHRSPTIGQRAADHSPILICMWAVDAKNGKLFHDTLRCTTRHIIPLTGICHVSLIKTNAILQRIISLDCTGLNQTETFLLPSIALSDRILAKSIVKV